MGEQEFADRVVSCVSVNDARISELIDEQLADDYEENAEIHEALIDRLRETVREDARELYRTHADTDDSNDNGTSGMEAAP